MFQLITISLIPLAAAVIIRCLYEVPKIPEVDLNKRWSKGPEPEQEDTSIRPFKIEFNETIIRDLKQRLKSRRPLTKPLEGVQSQYGVNTDYLEELLTYWQESYDFKKRVDLLNQFHHYKTRIQGLDLHFIRGKPKVKAGLKVLPLLMLHGWPSSSKEFVKVIPILTSPKEDFDFVFDVVAADLPGFGFSEASNKPGFNPLQIGIVMRNLMRRLGFKQFYIQAGDWGSQCATHMATLFPNEILGFHTNMPFSSVPISFLKTLAGSLVPNWVVEPQYVPRLYPLTGFLKYVMRESGYFHLQATKPDTIGVALIDSPAGLAAWIIEKMAVSTNRDQLDTPHGGLEGMDLDDVLDTVTITWINNCIVTSMRIYAEGVSRANNEIPTVHKIPTEVPTAAINFKHEVLYQPDWILRDKFRNLVHSITLDFGGHYAALQTPEVLAEDVFKATVEFLKYHSKVQKHKPHSTPKNQK